MRSTTQRPPSPSSRPLLGALALLLLCLAAPNTLADNTAGCALTTTNAPADNCYTVTPPVGAVTIDGQLTGTEWNGAILKNLNTAGFLAKIRFRRSGPNLVFLISVNDTNGQNEDKIQLKFDPLHNHTSTPNATDDDVVFEIVRNPAGGHNKTTISGVAPWSPGANLAIRDTWLGSGANLCSGGCVLPDFADGWAAEVVITPADLGLPDMSAIVGFSLNAISLSGDITSWPDSVTSVANYANIKTRYPIKYELVLDQSGSMLSQNKWDDAKRAANYLANTMAIVREPLYFNDKLGVVTFAWNSGANTDLTMTPKLLTPVGAFPLGDFVPDPPVTAPLGSNFTPIGKGLDAAFTNLGTGVEETQRVVLFMSDGLHNRPTTQVPLLPMHLTYDPCGPGGSWGACPPGTDIKVHVSTVALGQESGVDTSLLNNIKARFGGDAYNITADPEDLKEIFISSLDPLYQLNMVSTGASGTEFDVDPGERRLIVINSWTTPAGATTFNLQRKDKPGDPWPVWPAGQVACEGSPPADPTVGFAYCPVTTPKSGHYRAVNAMGSPFSLADRQFVLVDLRLRARFALDQIVHGTGEDILLTAALNEAGTPVTNDPATHPVKVTVSIKRPTEGFGTYVSTHDPNDCSNITPAPPPAQRDRSSLAGTASFVNPALTAAGMLAASSSSGTDVKPPRFARIDSLFSRCGKTDLGRTEDPGLDMFDDGTHGDVTANDGVYTLRFQNTQFEGSYVFRFKAAGKSPSGSDFSRVKTIADYVRVNVDPQSTSIDSRDLQQVGTVVTREYFVIPRDHFGGFLGPGYPYDVKFDTTAGTFVSPVIDYNNGVYSQVLRFDRATENPVVTGTVQGKPVGSKGTFTGQQGFEFFPYVGGFFFTQSQGLDSGPVVGARFGYRFPNQLALEAEGGVTFTKFNFGVNNGRRVHLIQLLANVRYDIEQWGNANWTPYVIGGAGAIVARSHFGDDDTLAAHAGFGSTFRITNHVGFRADGRVFHLGHLYSAPAKMSFQLNAGFVFRF